ncbi:GMC oxidoreductase family protein [Trichuris trichiura]|uniref:GMC oxidoreductase family protein n=1 Tax=Trichuris trichiura TaxID=36087 RepID=A0A077YV93_TRITR|nr:GMC oxidoreductase family protein [Trichuris trichiura]
MLTTLLTLASLYSSKLSQYPHEMFPGITDNVQRKLDDIFSAPFDFVIVGSGYSGSLLARRLAASGCQRILVLEAGGPPDFDTAVPFVDLGNTSTVEWNYLTTSQKRAALEMVDHKVHLRVAKVLGGNSVLGSSAYVPCNPDDFRRWAHATGAKGWADMDRYLFKLSATEDSKMMKTILSNRDLMNVIFKENSIHALEPLKLLWLHAGRSGNHSIVEAEKDIFQKGGFFVPRTLSYRGTKLNPAAVYLSKERPNLVVICHAEAAKLFQKQGSYVVNAVKVRDLLSGNVYDVSVRKEIILAAGAIGTAKILIQSGYGPSDHLRQLHVPIRKNLPVGVRMYDRVSVQLPLKVSNLAMKALVGQIDSKSTLLEYLTKGEGLLANTSTIGVAMVDLDKSGSPDIMLELKPAALTGIKRMMEDENFRAEVEKMLDPNGDLQNTVFLEIVVTLLHPMSQGTMWLWRQTEKEFVPRMNPSYLTDMRDVRKLARGVRFVEKLISTPVMKEAGAALLYPNIPSCPTVKLPASEAYIDCLVRHMATTGEHLTSTAPIGSVVDDNLKLKRTRGVRIVDESVFPTTATGGMGATLLALSNRAADLIRSEHDTTC